MVRELGVVKCWFGRGAFFESGRCTGKGIQQPWTLHKRNIYHRSWATLHYPVLSSFLAGVYDGSFSELHPVLCDAFTPVLSRIALLHLEIKTHITMNSCAQQLFGLFAQFATHTDCSETARRPQKTTAEQTSARVSLIKYQIKSALPSSAKQVQNAIFPRALFIDSTL